MSVDIAAGSRALAVERELLAEMALLAAGQDQPDEPEWSGLAAAAHDTGRLDPAAGEAELDRLARRARTLLLRRGHRLDEEYERSPDLDLARTLPGGAELRHSYERSLPAVPIERKLAGRHPNLPPGWQRQTIAFSSGMAALTTVVQGLSYLLAPSERQPLRLDYWGDYFETGILLEYLSGPTLLTRALAPPDLALAWTGRPGTDVLLAEPVRYNWSLDALPVADLLAGWRGGPARPPVIVLDTTLCSPAWPTPSVLQALDSPAGAPLVIEVRSGLKLDQQGLEVANLGVVDVFQPARPLIPELTAERVAQALRLARGTTGACLSAASVAALDAPFLLDEEWTRRHAGRVFLNNARLAERLAGGPAGGLFASVAHPRLDPAAGRSHAPFVVAHLRENGLAEHGMLLAVIRHEARRRGLTAVYGSSFGFRTTRYESIVPRTSEGIGLFKVSAGARGGPSLDRLGDLLVELDGYPSAAALRAAYGHLTPVRLS